MLAAGIGTLLQDLRETYLHVYGGVGESERDRVAKQFDYQLTALVSRAQQLELESQSDLIS